MRRMAVFAIAAALSACATQGPPGGSPGNLDLLIAGSLGHKIGGRTHYSVSAPWAPLTGGDLMLCVREDTADGRGGIAPTSNYSIFVIRDGRIESVIKDNTILGCPNRAYSPLPAV